MRLTSRFVRALFNTAWQSVLTWVVILTLIGAVIALVASQAATIDALRTRSFQLGQTTSQASTRYDRLFDEYSKLYDESEQQGVKPSTTDPSSVPSKATSGSTTGTPGATGATGSTGQAGAPGKDGRNGKDCEDGSEGEAGAAGSTGATGDMGVPGQTGATGATGATGPQGPTGATGAAGKDGTDGKDGRGVASVSCVATDTGTAYRFTFTDSTTTDIAGDCVPPVTPTDPANPAG
ncbi:MULTISPECIES: hypothetical protein [unclassified Curtobacterium]|uniref:hypothetical protein n=1 Tax=unclassified Curtobacterium TaxID=257496 RepID=UPI0037F6E3EC